MKVCIILILSMVGIVSAQSESWQCRNDLEITCSNGKCEAKTESGFTPMSVSFDASGKMSVCAYTGCWEGTGKVSNNGNFMMLSGQNLKFSTSDMVENISITLDKKDNVAMLKAGSFAQPLICQQKEIRADLPTFMQYKVAVSKAKPKPIIFNGNRNARMFRTRLGEALNGGVNFAGHFIFATWGCGTSCVQGSIIDTKTGVVYFPEEIGIMTFGYLDDDEEPLQYQADSNLFVLNGTSGESEDSVEGIHYLVWEGTKFKKVKFVKKESRTQ
jgi:hypothetical protein